MAASCGTVYIGRFAHSTGLQALGLEETGYCRVSPAGAIEAFGRLDGPVDPGDYGVVRLAENEFMMPGFVDTHTHAAQYGNMGVGLQYQLLEWLDRVTFPTEASFACQQGESLPVLQSRVRAHYRAMVRDYLKNGTTTCCYFASIQVQANLVLAECLAEAGQRAFVGKVCMDCNAPDFYCEGTEASLRDAGEFAEQVLGMANELVRPIVTPRFAVTCTAELMGGLGRLAKEKGLGIQTHLSENMGECAFVKELFPAAQHYTDVYRAAGLLGPRTVLAHAIYLTDEEQELVRSTGSAIAHCPNSNFALSSGIMPLRKYLDRGIKVGLGTDVSGGYSVSMLDAIRQTLIAAKALSFSGDPAAAVSLVEAFFLATLGGAQALGLAEKTGSFAPGKSFDALRVSVTPTGSLRGDLERFLLCGDDRNIVQTIVQGCTVA